MAVFRIERTQNYTVMSNHHLRNHKLSLKAKGLLSMMLSLPDDWNYTTRGLAKICKEGVDAISGALRELEKNGYIIRNQLRDSNGRIRDTEYVIYEKPHTQKDSQPDMETPDTEKPYLVKSDTEKSAEINIDITSKEELSTDLRSTHSIPSSSAEEKTWKKKRQEMKVMSSEDIATYRNLILDNIEYPALQELYPNAKDELHEIVELILETVCSNRKTTKIASDELPHELVRSRFLKLNCEHIGFVLQCLKKNTTQVRNMKQYLLTVLFNAPATMNNQYAAQYNHDAHINGWANG